MKPLLVAALCLGLTGCLAGPSHESDAGDLRAELEGMPGVSSVELAYREPITLDSGKVRLTVTMTPKAPSGSVADVVAVTYAAFSDVHRSEEGDLDVVLGEDTVHLRSFEPVAKPDAVRTAVLDAFGVLASGVVTAEINTQDVAKAPHVSTWFTVDVEQPGRKPLMEKVAELSAAHADVPPAVWRVQSGGDSGWLLQSDPGLPGSAQLALFDELSRDLPRGTALQMYGEDSVTAHVPADSATEEVSRMARRHLQLLGGVKKAAYDVQTRSGFAVMNMRGDCTFDPGRLGARLKQDFGSQCTTLSSPE